MSSINILIIDDEPGLCWVLEKALREENYQVTKAADGIEGLKLLSSNKTALVLLDYQMPGMSGLKVLERIKEMQPDLPVVFMTGHSSIPTALEAIKKGAVAYVTKPFHLADMKETIKKYIGKNR